MEKQMVMNVPESVLDRQACVLARMSATTDKVKEVAKARGWNGAICKALQNRVLHYVAKSVKAL